MNPIEFPQQNIVFGKNQQEYNPLPAHIGVDGVATSCWRPTFTERLRILFGTNLYLSQVTFNKPLQPIKLTLEPTFAPAGEIEKEEAQPA